MIKNKQILFSILSMGLALILAGCPSASAPQDHSMKHDGQMSGSIHIHGAWVREVPPVSHMSAAYMTLVNHDEEPDYLVSAKTSAAEVVEIHNVIKKDGMMKMVPVPSVEIPAGGEQYLKQGGYHIMLIRLVKPLKEGDKVELMLNFKNAGMVKVIAPVKPGQAMKKMDHDSMNHGSMDHN